LMHPVAYGTSVSGGLRLRKGVPSARVVTNAGLAVTALLLGMTLAAYSRRSEGR